MLININCEFYLEMLKHRCRSMGEVEVGDCRSMGMGRSGGAASSWTWDTGAGGTDSSCSWIVAAAVTRWRFPAEDGDCRSMGGGVGAASSWTRNTGAGGTDSSWTVAAAGARTRLPLPSAVESSDGGTLDTDLTKLNLGCLLSSPQKILN